MTIIATPIDPATGLPNGAAVTLGDDDSGDAIVDPPLLPVTRRPAQIVELAFSDQQFAVGRGNAMRSFNWTVARDHGDAATSSAFVHQHEGCVPINCQLDILSEDGDWEYSSAVITAVPFKEHYGVATTCQYMVEGAVLAGPVTDSPS